MSKEIVIATKNADKVSEFKQILEPLGYCVKSLFDIQDDLGIEETGTTFEENALIKARALYKHLNMAVISDDSGICINHLNGEPGVYSARFLGENTSYEYKNNYIIEQLKNAQDRGAQYVCAMAYIDHVGVEHIVRGECIGSIASAPEGNKGFGYDPIFYYPPFKTTLANVSEEQKNSISHRAKAVKLLLERIQ